MEEERVLERLWHAEEAVSAGEPSSELLEACRAGDRRAFGCLFETYGDYVFSLASHLTRDESLAADVTQEVFVKLLTRIRQYRGEARFRTYLSRIVLHAVLDQRRARRADVPLEAAESPPLSLAPSPESEAARRERARAVRVAVLRLPAKLRAPLVLRYVSGLSYTEIAQSLGISSGTVASRLSRAHERLAREFGREPRA